MTRELATMCVFCGQEHGLYSQLAAREEAEEQGDIEAVMAPGDSTMCFGCGQMNVMGEDGKLRQPTPEEQVQMDSDERVQALRKAWREVRGVQ